MPRARNGTVYDLNGPEAAPAVVLIHGLGSSRKSWREIAPAIAQRYRVLAYDLFGHGESAAGPGEASLGKLSGRLLGLLDELDIARATLDTAIARWFNPEFIAARPDVIAETRKGVLANDPVNYAAWRMVLAKGVVGLIRPDPPFTAPSLVMTCEHDSGSTPAMSHAIAAEIAGSTTIIVPDLKHMGLAEQPDAFTGPVLAFLDTVLSPGKGS